MDTISGMTRHEVINRMSERQLGLVLVDDALAAGVSRSALSRGIADGLVEPLSGRVLRVRAVPRSDRQSVLAAVLEAGPGVVAAGPTAAALWSVRGYRLLPVHLARLRAGPAGRPPPADGAVWSPSAVGPHHVTVLDSVPVVRPEVVVFELCGRVSRERAGRLLDDLWRRRLLSGRSLRRTLDELAPAPGSRAASLLRSLLDERHDGYVPPDSGLERRFAQILARGHIPAMRRQVHVGGDRWIGRVDFRDSRLPLVVEIQSDLYHAALTDRRRDAARAQALRAAGFEVIEITEDQLWHRPEEVVAAVREARWRLHVTLAPRIEKPFARQRGRT
jgi:very-short-patch-repair endonuclease